MPCDPQKLDALATIYVNWMASLSDEDRAKREKMQTDYIKNPQMWNDFMQEMFAAADANGDGLLDEAEYIEYARNSIEQAVARHNRIGPAFDEARHRQEYECWNALTPDVDGVSITDLKVSGAEIARAAMKQTGGPAKPESFDLEKMEQLAQIHATFFQGLSEEDRQRKKAREEADRARGAEAMAELFTRLQAIFTEADANGDGRLNLEEYLAYARKATEFFQGEMNGVIIDFSEERCTLEYELYSSWNAEAEGCNLDEITKAHLAMTVRVNNLLGE